MAGPFDWLLQVPEEERNVLLEMITGQRPQDLGGQPVTAALAQAMDQMNPAEEMRRMQMDPMNPQQIQQFYQMRRQQPAQGQVQPLPAMARPGATQRQVQPLAMQRPGLAPGPVRHRRPAQAQAQGPSFDEIVSMGGAASMYAPRPNDPRGDPPGPGASVDELIRYYTGQTRRR